MPAFKEAIQLNRFFRSNHSMIGGVRRFFLPASEVDETDVAIVKRPHRKHGSTIGAIALPGVAQMLAHGVRRAIERIGSAPCRARGVQYVWISVAAGCLKQKHYMRQYKVAAPLDHQQNKYEQRH